MDAANDDDILAQGREILRAEGEAVLQAAAAVDGAFARASRTIERCTGSVVVTKDRTVNGTSTGQWQGATRR